MPSQGLLSFLYSKASPSVIGSEWSTVEAPPLSRPARVVVETELGRSIPAKRYFELGIGKGELYKRFIAAGWHCSGVEPGSWGRAFLDVYRDMGDVPTSLQADVIVGLDVLEHLADPLAVLKQLRRLAAPGARLYCSVPNRQSFRARFFRTRWRMLRPLGHVNYWSRQSLTQAMQLAGFGIVKIYATDLWEPRRPKTARDLVLAAIERLGIGDQWIAIAEPQAGLQSTSRTRLDRQ